jgi:hypothetical protein
LKTARLGRFEDSKTRRQTRFEDSETCRQAKDEDLNANEVRKQQGHHSNSITNFPKNLHPNLPIINPSPVTFNIDNLSATAITTYSSGQSPNFHKTKSLHKFLPTKCPFTCQPIIDALPSPAITTNKKNSMLIRAIYTSKQ